MTIKEQITFMQDHGVCNVTEDEPVMFSLVGELIEDGIKQGAEQGIVAVMDAIEEECESRETCDGCRFAITNGCRLICFQGRMWEILSEFVEGESEVPKL